MPMPPPGEGGLLEMLELKKRLPYSTGLKKNLHNSPNPPPPKKSVFTKVSDILKLGQSYDGYYIKKSFEKQT